MAANTVLFKFDLVRNPQIWNKKSSRLLVVLRRFAAQSAEEKAMDKPRERSDSTQSEGEH